MTRLLITGGCSITDQKTNDYLYEGGVFTWPTAVADYMESKLLNVAKRGRGNDYIENMIFDAILENHDKYDCTVMVYWTEAYRVNLFDTDTLWDYSRGNQNELMYQGICQKDAINMSFRNMRRLKLVCDSFNIPCYYRLNQGFHAKVKGQEDVYDWLADHPAITEFNLSYAEVLSGRLSNHNDKNKHQWQTLPDAHPNQKGQDEIAKMFIDTMNGTILDDIEPTPLLIDRFVYD
tara:strand:- start:5933 stop:6634 length:702 start_codon:yes stop_codon:yes gene_type:complete